MVYLLDANVLMTAHQSYYPIDAVPEFWDWLVYQAELGNVKMPVETFDEVRDGSTDTERDQLYAWIQQEAVKRNLLLDGDADVDLVRRVVDEGYAPDLTDDELEQIGQDPFLVAHALERVGERCVVTVEVSRPSKQRQNRKVPDVCDTLSVRWCDTFRMLKELRFTTNWRQQVVA